MVDSLLETLKERTRNPFFATLIAVWLVRNWELIYTLFNFDEPCTLGEKKQFVFTYYHNKVWYEELFINISIAFGLMLVAYLLIIISRLIVNVTDHNIIPRMNEKTVSMLVVNRDIHNSVKNERNSFYNQLEEERENTIRLEEKFAKLKFDKAKLDEESLETRIKYDAIQIELQKSISDIKTLTTTVQERETEIGESNLIQEKMVKEIQKLNEQISNVSRNVNSFKDLNQKLKVENRELNNKMRKLNTEKTQGMGLNLNSIIDTNNYRNDGNNAEDSFKEILQNLNKDLLNKFQELISKNRNSDFEILNFKKDSIKQLINFGLLEIVIQSLNNGIKYRATNKGIEFFNYLIDIERGYDIS